MSSEALLQVAVAFLIAISLGIACHHHHRPLQRILKSCHTLIQATSIVIVERVYLVLIIIYYNIYLRSNLKGLFLFLGDPCCRRGSPISVVDLARGRIASSIPIH